MEPTVIELVVVIAIAIIPVVAGMAEQSKPRPPSIVPPRYPPRNQKPVQRMSRPITPLEDWRKLHNEGRD